MEYEDWRSRWEEGRIGFHLGDVHASLRSFGDRLLPRPGRVLVPLCGKAVDLRYLATQGHAVVGVEFVEQAAREFFQEQGFQEQGVDDQAIANERAAAGHPVYRGGGVEIHVADIFAIPAEAVGSVDAIFDRAALVAIDPTRRRVYAERLLGWLPPGGRLLLVTLSYNQEAMSGPPFSVPDDEVEQLFGEAATLERLSSQQGDAPPRLAERGETLRETVWLVTKR